MVAMRIELEATFTILWYQFNTLLVNIVMTVVALHALLEETTEKLFAVLTNGRSSVRVYLECVRNFHPHNCPVATIRSTTACAGVGNLLEVE